jgi:hypothetical protein
MSQSIVFEPHPVLLQVMLFKASTHCSDVLPGSVDQETASSMRALKDDLLSARLRYVLSGKTCRWALQGSHRYQSHLNVISLLHPGPWPDCPLTRMRGLELMSTRAFHPSRGQTPLLRTDVTPISRFLLDLSHHHF